MPIPIYVADFLIAENDYIAWIAIPPFNKCDRNERLLEIK